MELSKLEQETIILYNEQEVEATVYTYDPRQRKRLAMLAKKFPNEITREKEEFSGAVVYTVPKRLVAVRTPYTEERRKKHRAGTKRVGGRPPKRGPDPKNEDMTGAKA